MNSRLKEINQEIKDTQKRLKELEKEKFDLENIDAIANVQTLVGKCFKAKSSGTGGYEILKVTGYYEKTLNAICEHFAAQDFLIGDFILSYQKLTELSYLVITNEFVEISEEEYNNYKNDFFKYMS